MAEGCPSSGGGEMGIRRGSIGSVYCGGRDECCRCWLCRLFLMRKSQESVKRDVCLGLDTSILMKMNDHADDCTS